MQMFKHVLITMDHLLSVNRDGDLDKLLEDKSLDGNNKDTLKAMIAVRDAVDLKMVAKNHIILCHNKRNDGSISFRLVMHPRDILACKFFGSLDIDPGHVVNYPYGPVRFGEYNVPVNHATGFIEGVERDIVNSVEIARVYPDHIMYKPSFSIKSYEIDTVCAKATYDDYRDVYYGNFTIETRFSQKETDFGKLNQILSDGVDAYMSKQHNDLIETLKQFRTKEVLHALTPTKDGKLNECRVIQVYDAFFRNKKTSFYGNNATRFRVGKTSMYVFRALGAHHIHVKGIPGTVVLLERPPCTMGTCNEKLLDKMRRFADFVQIAGRMKFTNNAVIDLIFDAYVVHGLQVATSEHIFAIPYLDTEEYLHSARGGFILHRDKDKKYLWWLKWNGEKTKVGLAVGKGLHFFGCGWDFTPALKDVLEKIHRAARDDGEQQ